MEKRWVLFFVAEPTGNLDRARWIRENKKETKRKCKKITSTHLEKSVFDFEENKNDEMGVCFSCDFIFSSTCYVCGFGFWRTVFLLFRVEFFFQ